VIAGVVVLHIWALHVAGQNNPAGVEAKTEKDTVPFHAPTRPSRMRSASPASCCSSRGSSSTCRTILGDAGQLHPRQPRPSRLRISCRSGTTCRSTPILRSIPNKLAGVTAMFSAILVLAFLPWLDTAEKRNRPNIARLAKQFFWIFVIVCVLLGWLGGQAAPKAFYVIAGPRPDLLLLRLFS